jgi:uncharacterized membrane protein
VDEAPLGARIAERVTRFIGSWRFVVIQTVLVTIWIAINIGFITGFIPFDPYPFILLNLAFSTQAAYAAPLILLASNRSADHDRLVLEHIAVEATGEEARIAALGDAHAEILQRLSELESLIRSVSAPEVLARTPDAEGPAIQEPA